MSPGHNHRSSLALFHATGPSGRSFSKSVASSPSVTALTDLLLCDRRSVLHGAHSDELASEPAGQTQHKLSYREICALIAGKIKCTGREHREGVMNYAWRDEGKLHTLTHASVPRGEHGCSRLWK